MKWPIGPHYWSWVGADGVHAWVLFKLKSADWYLDTLNRIGESISEFDRYAGVEMGVDGALGSLFGAFDAAVGGLIAAIESKTPGVTVTRTYNYSWTVAHQRIGTFSGTVRCDPIVTTALAGSRTPTPTGWLAQLRQLRNRAVHHDSLNRHFTRGSGTDTCMIKVPGAGEHELLPYLREARAKTGQLCEQILLDIDRIVP
jgi:hypothetical protein